MTALKDVGVLIVDDYKTMLRLTRNLLEQLGFRKIDEAMDGGAALALLQANKYDLILSDWNMEPMSGLDLLKQVRAGGAHQATPFVMITAEGKPENIVAAKQAGVSNYIIKPFTLQVLKAKLSGFCTELK